ncbi:hydrolase [Lentzea tibetensis]|uniref:Hydrolase n=1 Tax=Lentzea tibetensis TaxID=2591470 RepID=A0A563EV15_9PSEU|nr:acyl-CoA dehydrogenase family protein [Lentzea tibetensis]TWP50994.1 hydrolase [Lentzea tibetensis]
MTDLIALIRAEAPEAEARRALTEPVVAAIVDGGLHRLVSPKRYGGAEMGLPEWSRTIQELSRADGSTGWTVMTTCISAALAWYLRAEGADEVFADPRAVIAGTAAPVGRGEVAPDGYVISGRWGWGSATPHSQWIIGSALTPDGPRMAVYRRSEVEIHDTWDAAGLCATGSHEFSVSDVFVPGHRAVWPATDAPGIDGPIPAFPYFGFLAVGVASVGLGIARRAVDEIEALALAKTPQHTTTRLAEQTGAQIDVALAEARLSSARAFLREELERCWELAVSGQQVPAEPRGRLRLACSHAAAEATEVTRTAFALGGGSAVFASSGLQRCLRDAAVAAQHTIVSRRLFETYAKVRFGFGPDTARF